MLKEFKNFVNFIGKFWFANIFFLLITVYGLGSGNNLIALIGFFYILGIVSRLPATYSDAIKEVECISTGALLLAVCGYSYIGAIFGFTCMWLGNLVSPWGKWEDMAYVHMDAIDIAIAALVAPWLFAYFGYQIIPTMFWFYVIRGSMYILQIPFMKMATWPTSTFLTFIGFFIAITQAYVVIYMIGPQVFGMLGLSEWSYGILPLFAPS